MIKNILTITSLFFLLIFIGGCEKISGKDPCADIKGSEYDNYMREECYYNLALEKNRESLCEKAGERSEECLRKVSINKAIESKNPNQCYQIGEFDYDIADCVTEIAFAKEDKSICESLPEGFGRVRDECYKKAVVGKKDIKQCDTIRDSENRKGCFEALSSSETYKLCNQFSEEGSTYCYIYSLCKIHNIETNCYRELESRTSDVTKKALEENKPSLCEGLGDLKPLCYVGFATKLDFSLVEVFKYNLFDQDEKLCEIAPEPAKEKCYFNLAITKTDEKYCEKTGKHIRRCADNVYLKKENLAIIDINARVRNRITKENRLLGIDGSGMDNAGDVLKGEQGTLDIFNDGNEKLQGDKFNLYKDLYLVDIDGCENNPVVFPKSLTAEDEWDIRHCILKFNTKFDGSILEVTYDGKTVLVY